MLVVESDIGPLTTPTPVIQGSVERKKGTDCDVPCYIGAPSPFVRKICWYFRSQLVPWILATLSFSAND